ncbi:MAG: ABC transporter substrate-binding protein [Promethearchaeota archaeon]
MPHRKLSIYCTVILLLLFSSYALSITISPIESGNINTYSEESLPITNQPSKAPFIYGTTSEPTAIDPLAMWDQGSSDMVFQCAEPLIDYNYSDPSLPIIPKLATNYVWHTAKEISFKIREGVYFHDGTLLTANSVAWNIYRIMWFCNYTGLLRQNSTSWEAFPKSMYYFPDGTQIIINATVNSMYNVSIFLTNPFPSLISLLTVTSSYILSPASTPFYNYLDSSTDLLVGTGPFVYEYYAPTIELKFHSYEDYWGGKADIGELVFNFFSDTTSLNNAFLAGQVDFIKDPLITLYSTIEADPDRVLLNGGESLTYYYLEFYCGPGDPILGNPWDYQVLNSTWRRALSLAINYTYIWKDIMGGMADPGCPAIPRMMPGYNSSLEGKMAHDNPFGGTYASSVKKAREYMQSMGFGIAWDSNFPGTNEMEWMTASFRTIEVNEIFGHSTNIALDLLLESSWSLIGVDIAVTIRTWGDYLNLKLTSPWEVECGYLGWTPDYIDPFVMLNPIFNNESSTCFSQLSDPVLKGALEAAATETDILIRLNIIKWIQSYIFDITRPENPSSYCHAPIFVFNNTYAHHIDLTGYVPNTLDLLNLYPCKWSREATPSLIPGPFNLATNAGSPDGDGIFDLMWNTSARAVNYSVYMDSKPIPAINESLALLAEGITSLTYPLSGFTDGTYYFIVEAWNENGTSISNSISVDIHIPGDKISLFDGVFLNQTWFFEMYGMSVKYNLTFVYTSLIGDTYYVNSEIFFGTFYNTSQFNIDAITREISDVQGSVLDTNGSHTNRWIYPNTELGDYYLISVDGEGDHVFQVTGETTRTFPGFGMLDAWVLTDLNYPNGFALYEKNTGINLAANFSYYYGTFWYGIALNVTNVFAAPNLPGPFTLFSTAGTPDNDGIFDLTWTSSSYADNYSVYEYSSYITVINGSLTTLNSEMVGLTLPLSGYSTGTYYFIVVAHNENGDAVSNCIQVIVTLAAPGPFILLTTAKDPDEDGVFDLAWTSSTGADTYSVFEYNSFITEINGSLTLVGSGITDLTFSLSGYANGTYYFVVSAHNVNGYTISNCVVVIVAIPPTKRGEPGISAYNIFFIIAVLAISITFLIRKSWKKKIFNSN